MHIEQIYTGCLAQGAYYIESKGEAVVIDPLREIQPYLDRAKRRGATIKYVFETHFHADFVSGHLDLAKATGATIVYGPGAKPSFAAHVATDNEVIPLGDISFRVLHTPGHTMESTCYLLRDNNGKDYALFSGDTLFIGDVGRPDLAQKVIPGLTPALLAGHLYDSLHQKIMPLADDIIVYPAHGAGSACGKNMSKDTQDTLGHQKATNYALRAGMNKDQFIREVLDGLVAPPAYFPMNVLMNIRGYDSIAEVIHRAKQAMSPDAFEAAANETNAVIIDTRDAETFAAAFVPNAINIGIDGNFAPWAGTLLPDIEQPILLITEPGREEEVVTRLARVGYDHTIGFLEGGFASWKNAGKETDRILSISAAELAARRKEGNDITVLDIRKKSEFDSEHLKAAINIPLDFINDNMASVPKTGDVYVHCAGGYRSTIFISILRARGYQNLVNVKGGLKALKENGDFALSDYRPPLTAL